jgi:hypothetical protein
MSEPLALTLGQKFELERMSRAIDATTDPQVLRGLAKQLLEAWHSQKAATQWVMRQQLGAPPRVASSPGDPAMPADATFPPSFGLEAGRGPLQGGHDRP